MTEPERTAIVTPVTTRQMVEQQLGQTMAWWYRHGRALREQHGFPAPLPRFGKRKWEPRAVEAWKLARMPVELRTPAPPEPPPPPDAPEARSRRIADRIARVVGG